jgi:3,4-dihydroxy-2-butanone 4-phosphate synthase
MALSAIIGADYIVQACVEQNADYETIFCRPGHVLTLIKNQGFVMLRTYGTHKDQITIHIYKPFDPTGQ